MIKWKGILWVSNVVCVGETRHAQKKKERMKDRKKERKEIDRLGKRNSSESDTEREREDKDMYIYISVSKRFSTFSDT
jgi:uncharacterized protein (DUF2225 family)